MSEFKIGELNDSEVCWKKVQNTAVKFLKLFHFKYPGISNPNWEDIFSDTVLDFWENYKNGKLVHHHDIEVGAYIYRIIRNKTSDHLKKNLIPNLDIDSSLADLDSTFFPEDIKETMFLIIEKQLDSLGEICRNILRMFYFEDKSHQEILQRLNFANENISMQHLSRCRSKLRDNCMTELELVG